MKRVLIDVNSIVQYRGFTHLAGVGRSTLSLLEALAKNENLPFELQLYSLRVRGGGLDMYHLPFEQFRIPLPNQDRFKKIISGLRIKEILKNFDLFHIPHNTDIVARPGKTVFTIHDLMIYRFPEFFPHTESFSNWSKKLMKDCKAVVTCSESSKNDIASYWSVPEQKITVINWGIDRLTFYPSEDSEINQIKKSFNLNKPFFLAVSCSHPRKNVKLTLEAFRIFAKTKTEHQLVLIWSDPPREILTEYQQEIQNEKIRFIRNISDNDLRALYSAATATIFPSLYEGFGFPVLESIACHTPVITCKNSSLAEIGADLAIYTSETDIEELVEILKKVSVSEFDKSIFSEKAEKHLLNYNWENTADKYIDFYLKNLE